MSGADPTGVSDSYAAWVAAKAAGKFIYFPEGTYLMSAVMELGPNDNGHTILGAGPYGTTIIQATHSDGPVIRVKRLMPRLSGFDVTSSAARLAGKPGIGGDATNCGIMLAPEDTTGHDVQEAEVSRVRVLNQPNSGIVIAGGFGIKLWNVWVDECLGHGVQIERTGPLLGHTTNDTRPGGIEWIGGHSTDNQGHAFKIGDTTGGNNYPLRITIRNVDTFRNCAYDEVSLGDAATATGTATSATTATGTDQATDTILLTDTAASFLSTACRGMMVYNTTDGSSAIVKSVDSDTQLTCRPLTQGTDDDFDVSDAYMLYFRKSRKSGGTFSAHYSWYVYAENSELSYNGIGGNDVNRGLFILGRDIQVDNNRFIKCVESPIRLTSNSADSIDTRGIDILGGRFENVTGAGSNYDPVVEVPDTATVRGCRVYLDVNTDIDTTASATSDPSASHTVSTKLFEDEYVNQNVYNRSLDSVLPRTVADDDFTSIEFDAASYGVVVINGSESAAEAAVVHFRVGSSVHCTLLANSTNVEATTGALAGTTGTDAKLTVSAHTDNKLYIENRTGSSKDYSITLLGINGGTLLAAEQLKTS